MNDLLNKAWKVVNSCQTPRQARTAICYLNLLAEKYPELDIGPLKRELITLFELT